MPKPQKELLQEAISNLEKLKEEGFLVEDLLNLLKEIQNDGEVSRWPPLDLWKWTPRGANIDFL